MSLIFIRIVVTFVYKVCEIECVTAEHVDEREDDDVEVDADSLLPLRLLQLENRYTMLSWLSSLLIISEEAEGPMHRFI